LLYCIRRSQARLNLAQLNWPQWPLLLKGRDMSVILICILQITMAPDSQLPLICAIERHESDCDSHAIKDECYGCLQIRQVCIDDVNQKCHTKYKAKDVLGNRALSIWVFRQYMVLYATKERLRRIPTQEDMARIWNGGPDGWRKKSTLGYWHGVKRRISPD